MSLIRASNVSKCYLTSSGEVNALDPLSLGVEEGEFVSILGPSGCGKSTLMLMVAGLISRSTGTIEIDGMSVNKPYTDVGVVFQEHNLLEWRSVLDNILLQIAVRGRDTAQYRDRALTLLRMVGLEGTEDRLPHELSGGQRQRAAICRALIHEPRVLLMDEPFGALDALSRDQLNVDMQQMWLTKPTTVIFITHSISEAVYLSDRVVVMTPRPGKIAADIKIDLPRPRPLSVRETPSFGAYTKQIRDLFEEWGVLRRGAP